MSNDRKQKSIQKKQHDNDDNRRGMCECLWTGVVRNIVTIRNIVSTMHIVYNSILTRELAEWAHIYE